MDFWFPLNNPIKPSSVTKQIKISTKTTYSYTLLAGNASINPQRKFLPLQWKALPTKPYGTAMGTKTAVLIPLPIFS